MDFTLLNILSHMAWGAAMAIWGMVLHTRVMTKRRRKQYEAGERYANECFEAEVEPVMDGRSEYFLLGMRARARDEYVNAVANKTMFNLDKAFDDAIREGTDPGAAMAAVLEEAEKAIAGAGIGMSIKHRRVVVTKESEK